MEAIQLTDQFNVFHLTPGESGHPETSVRVRDGAGAIYIERHPCTRSREVLPVDFSPATGMIDANMF